MTLVPSRNSACSGTELEKEKFLKWVLDWGGSIHKEWRCIKNLSNHMFKVLWIQLLLRRDGIYSTAEGGDWLPVFWLRGFNTVTNSLPLLPMRASPLPLKLGGLCVLFWPIECGRDAFAVQLPRLKVKITILWGIQVCGEREAIWKSTEALEMCSKPNLDLSPASSYMQPHQWSQLISPGAEGPSSWALPEFLTHRTVSKVNGWCFNQLSFGVFYYVVIDNCNRLLQCLVIADFLETIISIMTHKPLSVD